MPGRYVYIGFTLFIFNLTLINPTKCLEEEKDNFAPADITIHDNQTLKKIEVRNRSNANATFPETPKVIQQGNNVYIKPKFIIGSPFTSYKHGNTADGCCDSTSFTSKVRDEETNIVIGKPNTPQIPSFVVPPIILPPLIEDNMVLNPPRFPLQPQIPVPMANPCRPRHLPVPGDEIVIPMPCPTFVVPVTPDFPQPPMYPILVDKPVRPIVIPKPPELPPIILPHLPIQVLIQNSIFTKPPERVPITVPPLCPPMVKCITPEKNLPSFTDIITGLFEKFKNLVTISSKIDFNNLFAQAEKLLIPDGPIAIPTLCAQSIIAERVVPNIVKNDDIKVLMSPFIPSQFTSDNNVPT